MDNYVSKLVKGAGIIFFISIFNSALGYFIRLLLAKKMSIEEFGLFFAVYGIVLTIGSMKGLGTTPALRKFIPEYVARDEYDKIKSLLVFVFVFSILSSVFLLLVFYLLPERILINYFQSGLAQSLLLLLFTFVAIDSLSKLISSYFLSRHLSLFYSLRELIVKISILLLLLFFSDINVIQASLFYITATIVGLVFNFIFFFKHFPFFHYKAIITKRLIRNIFKFSTPLLFRDLFGVLMGRVDSIVLVYFRPLIEAGIYNAINPTADLLLLFSRPFGKIMFPMSSELWALNNKEKIIFLSRKIHKYLFLLMVPAVVGIYLFSEFLLGLLFGQEYAVGAFGLKILITGFIFSGFNLVNTSILMGIGRPKEVAKTVIFANVLNLFLNLLLIPFFGKFGFGYLGAIISTIFCQFLMFFLFLKDLKILLGYKFPLKDCFFAFLVGVLLFLAGLIIVNRLSNPYFQLITYSLMIFSLYPLVLIYFNVISTKDIKSLINLFLKEKSNQSS